MKKLMKENRIIELFGLFLMILAVIANPLMIEYFFSPDREFDFIWKYFVIQIGDLVILSVGLLLIWKSNKFKKNLYLIINSHTLKVSLGIILIAIILMLISTILYQLNPAYALSCEVDSERCEMIKLSKKLKDTTYVSDEGNFIDTPFTKEEFISENINIELRQPWDFEFLPDNSIIITERGGSIKHFKNNKTTTIHNIPAIHLPETGLMGLAIDPEFETNNYVYVQYTYSFDNEKEQAEKDGFKRVLNRISRFKFENNKLVNEKILIDKIPGSGWHSGGRLEFGPDGKLYATTGDAKETILSQEKDFIGGKILRLNKNGNIPSDNPFSNSYVYSLGHRNPQGLAWNTENNILYASEHGPTRYDEINNIFPGKNYGWGGYKCDKIENRNAKKDDTIFPLVCAKKWTLAPSGMEFINDQNSPWNNNLFVSSLRGKHLHRYKFENNKQVIDEIFYINEEEDGISRRIRDVEYRDGSLYIIGDSYGMVKLTPK